MPGVGELFARFFANDVAPPVAALEPAVPVPVVVTDAKAAAVAGRTPKGPFAKLAMAEARDYGRRPISVLRNWSRTNEWVRIAINRRKRQVSQARNHIVRIDDPTAQPDPKVVAALGKLFRFVNPKRESLRTLFDLALEDLLVCDWAPIEKARMLGSGRGDGPVVALHAVDAATIFPVKDWDGEDATAPRYLQDITGQEKTYFRNDQMLVLMANPMTYSNIGWSPVETCMRSIEADLYGDDYDYDMLRQTAPAGVLDMGRDALPADVAAFRSYWESEIAGQRRVGVVGGGGLEDQEDGTAGKGGPSIMYHKMQQSAQELERAAYRQWTATKIAAVFEMDLGVFNLTANLHKDTGGHQQALTDEGHRSLAMLVEEFFSREIVWDFDERHAFRFVDLNARDAIDQAKLDKFGLDGGYLTPNMILAREGSAEKLPWGDRPFISGKGPYTGASTEGDKPDDEGEVVPGESEKPAPDDADPSATDD